MGIKKTSPSHLSISKFQPQQSFYTKNYLKHNKPSQIKQNKQQTNISPQNIVDFGGSPGWIWVFSFSHQISPHFGVTHLGLAAAMTTSGSSATSAFKRSFSPLIPGKVMGERFGKRCLFVKPQKGGARKKTQNLPEIPKNAGLEQELKRLQIWPLWVSMLNFRGVIYVRTKTCCERT